MNAASPASLTPAVVIRMLNEHRYLWIAPAAAGFVLAAYCAVLTPRTWSASQGLIIRSEAAGFASQRLGKFTDLSEMKTVQETLLELARSHSVVSAVLTEAGPPTNGRAKGWPTREDIATFRKRLTITPPGGAEFGNTEVFYVEVKDNSAQRAERLVAALSNQLEQRLQSLRNERASSMVHELERSVSMAEQSLSTETDRLAGFEVALGPQLSELRNLISSTGSQSSLEQQAAAIEQEIRVLESDRQKNEQLLKTLRGADRHPERLLSTPSSLLETQPTLLRLKQGLVDAQIRTAELLGSRSPAHPMVRAASETEEILRAQINQQAPQAIRGVEMELAVNASREESLREKLVTLHATQAGLASKRAEYSRLLTNVENQSRVVEEGRKQLADARAHRAGSTSASVLARIDDAEAGLHPIGPGRTSIALAGGMVGLIAGVGSVFVFFAPRPAPGGSGPVSPQAAPAPQPARPAPAAQPTAFAAAGRPAYESPALATLVCDACPASGPVFVAG